MTALLLLLALSIAQRDTGTVYARAESLLMAGDLKEARAVLESHLHRDPADARAMTLLARVHLAWPVVGRWEAWRLLREATRLDPDNPEPWYWKIKVGKYLGSADGESLMRSGIHGVLARDPAYRDVWDAWGEIYHGPGDLREVAAILARHASNPTADLRRAQLLTEAGDYGPADSLLDLMIFGCWEDGGVWAIRAEAALEAGDAANGLAYYDAALSRAASDSLGFLWRQVAPIAWPDEDSTYADTAPEDREAFLRAFWARREPDLTTGPNERIAEHFTRLRYARQNYRLLHPQSRFHYSPERRALMGSESGRVLAALLGFDIVLGSAPGRSRLEDEIQAAGVGVDVRDVPEPDSITRYRRFGLDGRGLIYLRFGEPKRMLVDHRAGVEAWDYATGGTLSRVVFTRASAGTGGDMILYPTSRTELHNTLVMLEKDATSLKADLDVKAWVGFFRGTVVGEQMVYVGVNADTSAVAAWDEDCVEVQRSTATAPHVLTLTRGSYAIGVDTRRGNDRGRLRASIEVPTFWRGSLALSSLLAGVVNDTTFGRDEVARAMPGDERLPAGTPIALYTEIYGLSMDRNDRSLFEVEYRFEPVAGGRTVTLSFLRNVAGAEVVPERIVIQPGRVPPGRYRVHLTVRDKIRHRLAQSTHVRFELY